MYASFIFNLKSSKNTELVVYLIKYFMFLTNLRLTVLKYAHYKFPQDRKKSPVLQLFYCESTQNGVMHLNNAFERVIIYYPR